MEATLNDFVYFTYNCDCHNRVKITIESVVAPRKIQELNIWVRADIPDSPRPTSLDEINLKLHYPLVDVAARLAAFAAHLRKKYNCRVGLTLLAAQIANAQSSRGPIVSALGGTINKALAKYPCKCHDRPSHLLFHLMDTDWYTYNPASQRIILKRHTEELIGYQPYRDSYERACHLLKIDIAPAEPYRRLLTVAAEFGELTRGLTTDERYKMLLELFRVTDA